MIDGHGRDDDEDEGASKGAFAGITVIVLSVMLPTTCSARVAAASVGDVNEDAVAIAEVWSNTQCTYYTSTCYGSNT